MREALAEMVGGHSPNCTLDGEAVVSALAADDKKPAPRTTGGRPMLSIGFAFIDVVWKRSLDQASYSTRRLPPSDDQEFRDRNPRMPPQYAPGLRRVVLGYGAAAMLGRCAGGKPLRFLPNTQQR